MFSSNIAIGRCHFTSSLYLICFYELWPLVEMASLAPRLAPNQLHQDIPMW